MISHSTIINSASNSQMFSINVVTKDPELSKYTANTIAGVFKSKIAEIIPGTNVSIVSDATRAIKPISPNIKIMTLIGVLIGFGIGLAEGIIRFVMNTSVKDVSFFTDELNLSSLGTVNFTNNADDFRINTIKLAERRSRTKRRI